MPRGGARPGAGRRPKSATEHRLRGTYRASRHAEASGAVVTAPNVASWRRPDPPESPRGLSARARRLWENLWRENDGWTAADLTVLEESLRALDRADSYRRRIDRDGVMLTGPRGGQRAHPLLRIELMARQQAAALFRQLGVGGAR